MRTKRWTGKSAETIRRYAPIGSADLPVNSHVNLRGQSYYSMKSSLYPELKTAISGICSKLEIKIDNQLQQEYQNGKHPNLLSYEKVEKSSISIPTIQKYLIGAQTILNQPSQFYDIFRACRHYFFIKILDHALETNINKVSNYEERVEKLLKETTYDPFDAILFELAVSSTYALSPKCKNINFLESKSKTAPEFQFTNENKQYFVECKKFNRDSDIASQMRKDVKEKARPTLYFFKKMNKSAVIEVAFHKNPKSISSKLISDICYEAFMKKITIIDKSLTALVKPLPPQKLKEFALYPSPKYFWQRYRYRNQGEWFGLTSLINAKYGYYNSIENQTERVSSTWLDEADFECVFKWKITDENILWRYKKLGYNLLFKGLNQLQSHGENSILHAWLERDGFAGHRRNELLDFFSRLKKGMKDKFSWIVFNETIIDVSVGGLFDFIEHAHPISGPSAKHSKPIIDSIFLKDQDFVRENGEFGVGHELPDIDEVSNNK